MKSFGLFLMILMTCLLKAYGQFIFKNSEGANYKDDKPLLALGIGHPNFTKVDFELQYWIVKDVVNSKELFIIDHIGKKWQLNHYKFCLNGPNRKLEIIGRDSSELKNWNTTLKKLKNYDLFSLQDESIVSNKWRKSNGKALIINDGVDFTFELITKDKKRSFSYSNPKDYLKFYGSKYKELVSVNKIIETLNKSFNFKESDINECAK